MNQLGRTFGEHEQSPMRTGRSQGGPLTVGDSLNLVSAQVELGIAQEITVQITSDAPTDGIVCYTQATIESTIDGVTQSRDIDIAAGASITVVAKGVRVRVYDVSKGKSDISTGKKYNVIVSLALYSRAGGTAVPPIKTGFSGVTVPGDSPSQLVTIPTGASGVMAFGALVTGGTLPVLTWAITTTDGVVTLIETPVTPGQIIPLPAGAGAALVVNNSPTPAIVSMYFVMSE